MTSPDNRAHLLADVLAGAAHQLRNDLATVLGAVQLMDDPDAADALARAGRSLQVILERAVTLARLELDEMPTTVDLQLATLIELASRRAAREGAEQLPAAAAAELAEAVVHVPGPWAERLLADLLHHGSGTPSVARVDDHAVVQVTLSTRLDPILAAALQQLAHGCGGALALDERVARLVLPLSAE
jgi:signal transduction histidine kinase